MYDGNNTRIVWRMCEYAREDAASVLESRKPYSTLLSKGNTLTQATANDDAAVRYHATA